MLQPRGGEAPPPLPRNVKVLGLASLVNDVASEAVYPLLPQFVKVVGGTAESLGWIQGVSESVASLLKLWSGGWSDRAGRRGFVLLGYGLSAVARPLTGLATAAWQVVAARTGDRIGKGVRTAPRDALVADSTPPAMHGRAFGLRQAMDDLGAAVGPLLAYGFLQLWPDGLRPLFWLTAIPGLLVVALLAVGLREAPPAGAGEAPARLTLRPFGRDFRLYLLALVVFTLGNSSDLFLLWRLGQLGVAPAMLPLVWCGFNLLKSVANWQSGRAVDRFGARPLLLLGWLVYAGIYLAFALVATAWQAVAVFLVYALFYALTEPAEKAFVVRLAGAERKGLAYGWYNAAVGVAVLPANLMFGWLYKEFGAGTAFATGAGLALAAAALLLGVGAKNARVI